MKKQMIVITGQPSTGKTTVGKHFSNYFDISFLDKDIICDEFTFYIMKNMFGKEFDKDSHEYRENVRSIEYSTLKKIIKVQIELEVSFLVVAPFTEEIKEDSIYFDDIYELAELHGYDIYFIHLVANENEIKKRMIKRNKPEDKSKLDDWDNYYKKFESKKIKKYIKSFLNEDFNDTIENIINHIN